METARIDADVVNLLAESLANRVYDNQEVACVHDHAVRISVRTQAYHWHRHPDSNEAFLALEGGLLVHLGGRTIELRPGDMFTVYRGVRHRTRPLGIRSVNITFERAETRTETLAPPD